MKASFLCFFCLIFLFYETYALDITATGAADAANNHNGAVLECAIGGEFPAKWSYQPKGGAFEPVPDTGGICTPDTSDTGKTCTIDSNIFSSVDDGKIKCMDQKDQNAHDPFELKFKGIRVTGADPDDNNKIKLVCEGIDPTETTAFPAVWFYKKTADSTATWEKVLEDGSVICKPDTGKECSIEEGKKPGDDGHIACAKKTDESDDKKRSKAVVLKFKDVVSDKGNKVDTGDKAIISIENEEDKDIDHNNGKLTCGITANYPAKWLYRATKDKDFKQVEATGGICTPENDDKTGKTCQIDDKKKPENNGKIKCTDKLGGKTSDEFELTFKAAPEKQLGDITVTGVDGKNNNGKTVTCDGITADADKPAVFYYKKEGETAFTEVLDSGGICTPKAGADSITCVFGTDKTDDDNGHLACTKQSLKSVALNDPNKRSAEVELKFQAGSTGGDPETAPPDTDDATNPNPPDPNNPNPNNSAYAARVSLLPAALCLAIVWLLAA